MITVTQITTLGEFVDRVTPREPDPVTGRRRDFGVYRGSSDADAPLLTSLDRLGGVNPPHTKAELEEHILRNYIRYARPYIGSEADDDWEQLVSAQHHGVPTRLLDWSYSPLVAVFFATRPSAGAHDRAVWRLDWQAVHHAFGFPPLALRTADLDTLLDGGEHYSPWELFSRDAHEKPFACLLDEGVPLLGGAFRDIDVVTRNIAADGAATSESG